MNTSQVLKLDGSRVQPWASTRRGCATFMAALAAVGLAAATMHAASMSKAKSSSPPNAAAMQRDVDFLIRGDGFPGNKCPMNPAQDLFSIQACCQSIHEAVEFLALVRPGY